MNIDYTILESSLCLLAQLIPLELPQHYVVCGGSSLIALELVSRSTKDVEVLAVVKDGVLRTARPLPDVVLEAAAKVAAELDLPADWINPGPSDESLFRLGLPQGLAARLVTREFGPTLKIGFISRFDQIHLKLHAATDQGGRHLQDLLHLAPSREEALTAARWTREHDPSDGFLMLLQQVLQEVGYANLDL